MRLLIAEDDTLLAGSLAKGLREHAYAVDVVGNGDAAVIEAAVNEYDAIVLDVMLPQRDGLQVARDLRRGEITMHVWDENHDPFSNALEVYIGRLRRKVDLPGERPLIHTRRGAGYMLAESDVSVK